MKPLAAVDGRMENGMFGKGIAFASVQLKIEGRCILSHVTVSNCILTIWTKRVMRMTTIDG